MEKQNYLVCWLKESARAVCFLHSDRKFYRDFISCRGCNLVTYKTRAAAEKKAQTWKSCKDGRVIAVAADDVERLEQKARENFRRLLFSYEENDNLPAFEDAQPDANGVIKCATRSAASISAGARRFDALLSDRRENVTGWENAVLLIVKTEDYNNNGVFQGRPVFVVRPAELPNVRPEKLFNMLNGNGTFADKLAGVIDWESRAEWLACFTDEEKRAAVAIEKHLQTLAPAV